jgi:hypothetical protein
MYIHGDTYVYNICLNVIGMYTHENIYILMDIYMHEYAWGYVDVFMDICVYIYFILYILSSTYWQLCCIIYVMNNW